MRVKNEMGATLGRVLAGGRRTGVMDGGAEGDRSPAKSAIAAALLASTRVSRAHSAVATDGRGSVSRRVAAADDYSSAR